MRNYTFQLIIRDATDEEAKTYIVPCQTFATQWMVNETIHRKSIVLPKDASSRERADSLLTIVESMQETIDNIDSK